MQNTTERQRATLDEIRDRTYKAIEAHRPPDLPEIAERRKLRDRAGLTVVDVAGILGVTKSAVTHWELGTRRPSRAMAQRYAVLLNTIREAC